MGSSIMTVSNLKHLSFEPFPSRPVKLTRVVRVANTIAAIGESDNVVYQNCLEGRFCYQDIPKSADNLIEACIRLGLLPHEEIAAIKQRREDRNAARAREWSAKSLLDNASAVGIKLTVAQRRKAQAAIDAWAKHK